ncbi:MAG: hypothetical protein ACO1QB_19105 [Verrucomicrobiales bacterium]
MKWEEDDQFYIGYCPDLFPWGGVCHGSSEKETYAQLYSLVMEEIQDLLSSGKSLPPANTRPMRDPFLAEA